MSGTRSLPPLKRGKARRVLSAVATLGLLIGLVPAAAIAQDNLPSTDDPRYDLGSGYADAETASSGIDLLAHFDKSDTPFWNGDNIGSIAWANSDLTFTGDHVVQGSWRGFQIFDVSDPVNPQLRTTVTCPGGQGDTTVYGHLLFHSVEEASGRVDCGSQGAGPASVPNPDRFRGVRIWDISDLDNPEQVAAIQTCRGSHTNRLVEDPNDPDHVYVYVNGTSSQRSALEAVHTPDGFVTGRCGQTTASGPNPSQWMIEIIKVPLADPSKAEVVNEARLFKNYETGAVNGLQNGPTRSGHPCSDINACAPAGTGYSPSPNTTTCHDITAYPEIGLAAGACQGNGILIDISDPANPVRIDAVADENFAYWHSANFSNDGETVMFTDEWGGGTGARCVPHHQLSWGANAIFSIDRSGDSPKLKFESYYKLPAAQKASENCVAHQANMLPVPGRDIVIQAWYQGGASMFDMTDPANPVEIGYFDRGPVSSSLLLGGYWSAYWYNGHIYAGEIARGLDVLEVQPTEHLSVNEIAAAKEVQLQEHNAMSQRMYTWEPSFNVVRAYRDQLARTDNVTANTLKRIDTFIARAERFADGPQKNAAKSTLLDLAASLTGAGQEDLAQALTDLAESL